MHPNVTLVDLSCYELVVISVQKSQIFLVLTVN